MLRTEALVCMLGMVLFLGVAALMQRTKGLSVSPDRHPGQRPFGAMRRRCLDHDYSIGSRENS